MSEDVPHTAGAADSPAETLKVKVDDAQCRSLSSPGVVYQFSDDLVPHADITFLCDSKKCSV